MSIRTEDDLVIPSNPFNINSRSLCRLQRWTAGSTPARRPTCTWSRATSSWAPCCSFPPRSPPCKRPSVAPCCWASRWRGGRTAAWQTSGRPATCAPPPRLLHPAPPWNSAPGRPGARCPRTLNLNWARWRKTGGSGSPGREREKDRDDW